MSGIVLVSSVGRSIPLPMCVTYTATKAFVSYLAQALKAECEEDCLDVMCYEPGQVRTNMNKSFKTYD